MPEIKPVKVFTRERPCTKVDLWNCFGLPGGSFARRPVVEAQGEIGKNSIKYLLREGYAVYRTIKNIDYYELTPEGERWLTEGLDRYLKRHPDDRAKLTHFPAKE